jgi:hypothetical protein
MCWSGGCFGSRWCLVAWAHVWSRCSRGPVRYKGKRRQADVEVFTDEEGVVEQYEIIARDNHQFAEFNKIGLDQDGNPSRADLQLAWEAGARAFRLTLR